MTVPSPSARPSAAREPSCLDRRVHCARTDVVLVTLLPLQLACITLGCCSNLTTTIGAAWHLQLGPGGFLAAVIFFSLLMSPCALHMAAASKLSHAPQTHRHSLTPNHQLFL